MDKETNTVLQRTLTNLRQAISYGQEVIHDRLPFKTTHTWVVASTDKEMIYTLFLKGTEVYIKVEERTPQVFDFDRAQEIAKNTIVSNPNGPIQFRVIPEKQYYATKIPVWEDVVQTIERGLNTSKSI